MFQQAVFLLDFRDKDRDLSGIDKAVDRNYNLPFCRVDLYDCVGGLLDKYGNLHILFHADYDIVQSCLVSNYGEFAIIKIRIIQPFPYTEIFKAVIRALVTN